MIKDIRITPFPTDACVISMPGARFAGQMLSVEMHDGISHGVVIPRGACCERVAKKLRHLADTLEEIDE